MGPALFTVDGMFHGRRDGGSRALRLSEAVRPDDLFLQLDESERTGTDDASWSARLWSADAGPSLPVASIHAMSFASFVGRP